MVCISLLIPVAYQTIQKTSGVNVLLFCAASSKSAFTVVNYAFLHLFHPVDSAPTPASGWAQPAMHNSVLDFF
jgi:hypothetical protein